MMARLAPLVLACATLAGSASPVLCASYDDFVAGIIAHNNQDWSGATAAFDKALAAGDLLPDQQYIAHLDRGDAHAARREFDAAVADFSACVGQREGTNQALLRRADVYSEIGKRDLALADLDAAVAAVPDDASAHVFRAIFYEMGGDADKELADLEIAQKLNNDDKLGNLRIGIAQTQLGQFDGAAASFEQAQADYPAYAWMWLAIVDVKRGKELPASKLDYLHGLQWPDRIVEYYLGKTAEVAVLKETDNPDGRIQKSRQCDVNFYIGEWRMVHGDAAGATPMLRKAAEDCIAGSLESLAAIAELRKQ